MYQKHAAIFALSLLPFVAQAQAYPGPEHHQHRLEHLSKALNLSDAQKQQVGDLFQQQGEKFKAIHEQTQNQLQQILSPEQYAKLEALKKEKRHRRGQGLLH